MSREAIKISGSASSITEDDVVRASFGIIFHGFEDFRDFYLQHNGGKPDRTVIITDAEESSSIRYFLSIKHRFHPKVPTLEETNDKFRSRNSAEFFQDYLVFATDSGSNPTCIHLSSGEIVFVPMDCGPDLNNEKWHLAERFSGFVDKLTFFEEE